jgi:hypothetical protein
LTNLFAHVNYFGKRGSFWQFLGVRRHAGILPVGFSLLVGEIGQYALDIVARYRVTEYPSSYRKKRSSGGETDPGR